MPHTHGRKPKMKRKTTYRADVPVSVLMPPELQRAIADRARSEERTFSGLVRHALKKEVGLSEKQENPT